MEFRIYKPTAIQMGIGYDPSELSVSERLELIKQLCPEIGGIALKWGSNITATYLFLDYLAEQMENQCK
jgi:hypothetical protein